MEKKGSKKKMQVQQSNSICKYTGACKILIFGVLEHQQTIVQAGGSVVKKHCMLEREIEPSKRENKSRNHSVHQRTRCRVGWVLGSICSGCLPHLVYALRNSESLFLLDKARPVTTCGTPTLHAAAGRPGAGRDGAARALDLDPHNGFLPAIAVAGRQRD